MSYDAGITQTPGGATENTLKPVADTAAGLLLLQHSGTQSAPLLGVYDAAGTTFLGGIGPNASAVWKGLALNVTPRTTNYTTLGTDYYIPVDATAGAVTVTLKPSTGTPFGSQQRVTKVDSSANAVTVQRGGADTINGGTSITLTSQYDTAVLQSDGAGAWNAVLPVSLNSVVLLAPNTTTRNTVTPTADTYKALAIRGHSSTQSAALLEVFDNDEIGGLQVMDSRGSTLPTVTLWGMAVTQPVLQLNSAPGQTQANITGRYVDYFQIDGSYNQVSGISVVCKGGVIAGTQGVNLLFWGQSSTGVDPCGGIASDFADTTHATLKGRVIFCANDFNAQREGMRIEATGTAPMIGFLGATAVVRQTGGALTAAATYGATEQGMINSIWTALRAYGLLT